MYNAWHVVVLVFWALGVGLYTGFLIGRDWRQKKPLGYDTTNGRAPRSVEITPEIRATLQRLSAAERQEKSADG